MTIQIQTPNSKARRQNNAVSGFVNSVKEIGAAAVLGVLVLIMGVVVSALSPARQPAKGNVGGKILKAGA